MCAEFVSRWSVLAGETALRSLGLFALVGLAILALRRSSAAMHVLLWRLTFIGLAALPVCAIVLPPWPVSVPVLRFTLSALPPTAATLSPRMTALESDKQVRTTAPVDRSPTAAETASITASMSSGPVISLPKTPITNAQAAIRATRSIATIPWTTLLFAVWIVGVLLIVVRLLVNLFALRRLIGRTVSAGPALQQMAGALAQAVTPGRNVQILLAMPGSPEMSPLTWGALRPILLLPAGAEKWPEGRLQAVLLHELAHIARNDWLTRLVSDLICACYWFHPLVWLAARQLRRAGELACDDRVLNFGLRASDYAAHLLEIVRLRKLAGSLPSAAISMAQPALLEMRLRALLDADRSRRSPSRNATLAATVLLSLLTAPLAMARMAAKDAPVKALNLLSARKVAIGSSEPVFSLSNKIPEFAIDPAEATGAPRSYALHEPAHLVHLRVGAMLQSPEHGAEIVWGKAIRGLQIGLECATGHEAIVLGRHTAFRIWIRNRGSRALPIRYVNVPEPEKNHAFWTALVANGNNVSITPDLSRTGELLPETLILQPGEQHIWPGPKPDFLVSPMTNSIITESTMMLTSGKKTVRAAPFICLSPEDAWMQKLVTGALKLEVLVASEHPANSPTPDPERPETERQSNLKDVEWGPAADGLQAGIRVMDRRRRFTPGERVPLECYIRNASDHEVAFTYAYRVYMNELPIVRDAADPKSSKKVQGVLLTGLDAAFALILKPGEAVVLWHPGIALGDRPEADAEPGKRRTGLERWPFLEEPKPGDYLLQQSVRYHPITAEKVRTLAEKSHAKDTIIIEPSPVTIIHPDGSQEHANATLIPFSDEQATLLTGEARFTITAPDQARPATNGGKMSTKEATQANGIFWGPVVDGLQAGLRAPQNRRRYTTGELMKLDLLIRNVGTKEINFQYETHPGVKMTVPEVTNVNGRVMSTYGTPGALIVIKAQATLPPGRSVVIGQTQFGLSINGSFSKEAFSYLLADPGQYRMDLLHQIQRDGKDVILYTGNLPFELVNKSR
jgi:beta-lactamase regulating signal transducer with metallopeptidase domain